MPVETRYLLFDEKDKVDIPQEWYIKCTEGSEGSMVLELEDKFAAPEKIEWFFEKFSNSNTCRLIIDDKVDVMFSLGICYVDKYVRSNPRHGVSKGVRIISKTIDMEGHL